MQLIRKCFVWFSVPIIVSLVAACGTPGKNFGNPHLPQMLETEILANNSKMFVYRIGLPDDQLREPVRIARNGFGGGERERGGMQPGRNSLEAMKEHVDYLVKKMGYCREGFLVIDSSLSQMNGWVKGECREDATDDDRAKFGIKKTTPVKSDE